MWWFFVRTFIRTLLRTCSVKTDKNCGDFSSELRQNFVRTFNRTFVRTCSVKQIQKRWFFVWILKKERHRLLTWGISGLQGLFVFHSRRKKAAAASNRGCQIFVGTKYQKGENTPNYHEQYQMFMNYNRRP
jgi:hypothetical protein